MSRKRLNVDWGHVEEVLDLNPYLKRYKNHLIDIGLRTSTVESYLWLVKSYLEYAKTNRPTATDFLAFRETLHKKNLTRSTINNYSFAIMKYHEMWGEQIEYPFLKRNDEIPYYFDEEDVLKIFSVIHNIKHLAMLQTLFYGCLRASELCNLDDSDVDMKALTLRVREGKGGRDGIVFINDECAAIIRRYLLVRPVLEIDGRTPLFFTDYGKRWTKRGLHTIFTMYKKKAGIQKQGSVHVFSRHTPATLMIANGCDIRIVKEILRHRDIRTTLRYAHVSNKTLRERYNQCLTL
jgi:integrase/recombinase XerD